MTEFMKLLNHVSQWKVYTVHTSRLQRFYEYQSFIANAFMHSSQISLLEKRSPIVTHGSAGCTRADLEVSYEQTNRFISIMQTLLDFFQQNLISVD